jgi:hypothetical protein
VPETASASAKPRFTCGSIFISAYANTHSTKISRSPR